MKFTVEALEDIRYSDSVIEDKIIEHTRWSVIHELIFQYEGKFYATSYARGATEYQDFEEPWGYGVKEVECPEVKPVQKTITVYE